MLRTFKTADKVSMVAIEEEKRVRKTDELFLLFAMGSQFDHLIKQQMEDLRVFCLVADPASVTAEDVLKVAPKGIIVSGGPASALTEPPPFDERIFDLGIPVLGICLGFQMWAKHAGGKIKAAGKREFGVHTFEQVTSNREHALFIGCPSTMPVLESHGDRILLTIGEVIGFTENAPVAAARLGHLWGVQFHPEVTHTKYGAKMLENFVFLICKAMDRFPAEDVGAKKIRECRKAAGDKKILMAFSGGADSVTTLEILLHAVDDRSNLRAVYIKGIDRPDDEAHILEHYSDRWPPLDLKIVPHTERFLKALEGIENMHRKRLAVRRVYKEVLEEEAKKFGADFIAQGTLYTDLSESGEGYDSGARKAMIKLHHNVGLHFSLPELTPLNDCVKDTGRNIGQALGVSDELLWRHPFPGPGLVVRIEGVVTMERLRIARELDRIYIEELRTWGLYDKVWQAGAVVTATETTCTKGDDAATGIVATLWAVWSVNGFTAQWAELPADFLRHVSQRITNEIREIGAVTYRISDKPPSTIEMG